MITQLGAYGEGSPAMEQAAKTVCEFAKSNRLDILEKKPWNP